MTWKQHMGRWLRTRLPFSRRTFETLRFEFRILRQHWQNALLPWRLLRIARLRAMRGISLNVGSGGGAAGPTGSTSTFPRSMPISIAPMTCAGPCRLRTARSAAVSQST